MDLETYSRVTGLIYDAAIDPARWRDALAAMAAAFNGHQGSLITRNVETRQGRAFTTVDAESQHEFWSRWRHTPLAPRPDAPPASAVETDQDMLPKAELLKSPYYNEFLQPRGMHAGLMLWLDRQGPMQPTLSIMRSRAAGEYERQDVELGRLLLPHVQRAVNSEQRLRHAALTDAGAASMLDMLKLAVLILDCDAGLLHANRQAEEVLAAQDGIAGRRGRLVAATSTLTARLDGVLARAAGRAGAIAESAAMALPRPSGRPALMLLAIPVRLELAWLRPLVPAILVCIGDPAAAPAGLTPARLGAWFGLTATEAAVALSLVDGRSPGEIADRLGVRRNTVRVHLARIMGKTDTRRQAELVRLLSTAPPVDRREN